jgi:hypothetical protein
MGLFRFQDIGIHIGPELAAACAAAAVFKILNPDDK